jgi:hypothetical protein
MKGPAFAYAKITFLFRSINSVNAKLIYKFTFDLFNLLKF